MGRARIGVIGTGMMGRALVELLTRNAHEVGIGSRDLARAEDVARATPNAWAGRYSDVAAASDVLFWAVAWDYAESTLKALPDLRRAVLVDCSNPETPDGRGLAVGLDTSGAETIATLRPDARVIKAFCHTYAELLRKGPEFGAENASVLLCGDDPGAKSSLSEIIRSCAFDPVDCGPLRSARFLEPVAMLMVQLVREMGAAPEDVALKVLRRAPTPRTASDGGRGA